MDETALAAAALSLPGAVEGGHQGQRDFRVRKKVFATFDPGRGVVGLKLNPVQQAVMMTASSAFFPANGAWGAKGWTKATLAQVSDPDLIAALRLSWINTAPVTLARTLED